MLAQTEIALPGFAMNRPLVDSQDDARAAARLEERAAIEACLSGDASAFDVLVVRHQKAIQRVCYRFTGNTEDAADITQEVFVKAYRSLPKFRGTSAFSTWLYRIAVNACLNFRAQRRPQASDLDAALVDPRPGAEWQVSREDDAVRVRAAVSRLPERQRATLILKLFHELTHQEVAGILGSSVGTVKANLFHALANLRREMTGSREARS